MSVAHLNGLFELLFERLLLLLLRLLQLSVAGHVKQPRSSTQSWAQVTGTDAKQRITKETCNPDALSFSSNDAAGGILSRVCIDGGRTAALWNKSLQTDVYRDLFSAPKSCESDPWKINTYWSVVLVNHLKSTIYLAYPSGKEAVEGICKVEAVLNLSHSSSLLTLKGSWLLKLMDELGFRVEIWVMQLQREGFDR